METKFTIQEWNRTLNKGGSENIQNHIDYIVFLASLAKKGYMELLKSHLNQKDYIYRCYPSEEWLKEAFEDAATQYPELTNEIEAIKAVHFANTLFYSLNSHDDEYNKLGYEHCVNKINNIFDLLIRHKLEGPFIEKNILYHISMLHIQLFIDIGSYKRLNEITEGITSIQKQSNFDQFKEVWVKLLRRLAVTKDLYITELLNNELEILHNIAHNQGYEAYVNGCYTDFGNDVINLNFALNNNNLKPTDPMPENPSDTLKYVTSRTGKSPEEAPDAIKTVEDLITKYFSNIYGAGFREIAKHSGINQINNYYNKYKDGLLAEEIDHLKENPLYVDYSNNTLDKLKTSSPDIAKQETESTILNRRNLIIFIPAATLITAWTATLCYYNITKSVPSILERNILIGAAIASVILMAFSVVIAEIIDSKLSENSMKLAN